MINKIRLKKSINFQVFTYGERDGSNCKFYARLLSAFWTIGCDSFIELKINDELTYKSPVMKNKFIYDANAIILTPRIPKSSKIKIKIFDHGVLWEKTAVILNTKGDIDSFLTEPLRKGANINGKQNAIETVSFWLDEYK